MIKNREAQIALMAAGYYRGGIDGKFGPKSKQAFDAVYKDNASLYSFKPSVWREHIGHHLNKRKRIAAVQICLNKLGFSAGKVDGYEGHNTREALNSLLYKLVSGDVETIERKPMRKSRTIKDIPSQSQVKSFYGDPQTEVPKRLTRIELPFKYRIDWNLSQSTNKITVHELAAPSLERALIEVHDTYGPERMRALGLDRYAGAYNKRKMRGGSKWSMHAYGCAIDFYAKPNGLRMRCPDALFCGSEYKQFLIIMEKHGWLAAIRLWGADAMHFQRATL